MLFRLTELRASKFLSFREEVEKSNYTKTTQSSFHQILGDISISDILVSLGDTSLIL